MIEAFFNTKGRESPLGTYDIDALKRQIEEMQRRINKLGEGDK